MELKRIAILLTLFRYSSLSGIAAAFLYGLFSCSGTSDPGSGTGVGNGMIVGHVAYSNGTPPKSSTVRLRLQNFLPDTSGKPIVGRTTTMADVLTDSDGTFRINGLESRQSYIIEVNDGNSQPQATIFKCGFSTRDTVILSARTLEPVINITGTILLSGLPRNAYILIYGLERVGRSDSLGRFALTNLPVGECEHNECEYTGRAVVPLANGAAASIEYEFEIKRDKNGRVILPVELEISD